MSKGSSGGNRIARTREQWESLVRQFEASDLSTSAFCREQAVAPSSFNKARRRLRGSPPVGSPGPAPFVAVSVPEPVVSSEPKWDVELQLSSQTLIRVRSV